MSVRAAALLLALAASTWATGTALAQPPRPVTLELRALPADSGPGPGGAMAFEAVARIEAGWHVNTDRPGEEFLIASQLTLEPVPGWRVRAVRYPPPLLRRLAFAGNRPLRVWEHRAVMRVVLERDGHASSAPPRALSAGLRYQACSDRVCLPPDVVFVRWTAP